MSAYPETICGFDRKAGRRGDRRDVPIPATAAFWTISKLTRPDTSRTQSARADRSGGSSGRGRRPPVAARAKEPTTLSTALWRPTSSRTHQGRPRRSNRPAVWSPPVRSKPCWSCRRASGSPRRTPGGSASAGPTGGRRPLPDRSTPCRTARSSPRPRRGARGPLRTRCVTAAPSRGCSGHLRKLHPVHLAARRIRGGRRNTTPT